MFRWYQSVHNSDRHWTQTSLEKHRSSDLLPSPHCTSATKRAHSRRGYSCCGGGKEPRGSFELASSHALRAFHIRHRFVSDWIHEMHFRASGGIAMRLLLNASQIGGISSATSDTPWDISQSSSGLAARRGFRIASTLEAPQASVRIQQFREWVDIIESCGRGSPHLARSHGLSWHLLTTWGQTSGPPSIGMCPESSGSVARHAIVRVVQVRSPWSSTAMWPAGRS